MTSAGVEIAGWAGLIAPLLVDLRAPVSADIAALLRLGHVDLATWKLAPEQRDRLAGLQIEADDQSRRAIAWETRTGEPCSWVRLVPMVR